MSEKPYLWVDGLHWIEDSPPVTLEVVLSRSDCRLWCHGFAGDTRMFYGTVSCEKGTLDWGCVGGQRRTIPTWVLSKKFIDTPLIDVLWWWWQCCEKEELQ